MGEYRARPEVRAKRKQYRATPEARAKQADLAKDLNEHFKEIGKKNVAKSS